MTAWRGGLASILFVAALATVAAAAPVVGIDLTSSEWTVGDADRQLVQSARTGLVLELNLFTRAATSACGNFSRLVREQRGTPLPPGFGKDTGGNIPDLGFTVCRVAGTRSIVLRGELLTRPLSAAEIAAIRTLLDDTERALARQRTLVLPGLELDLGARFDRWQPSPASRSDSDDVSWASVDGPEVTVRFQRVDDRCAALDDPDEDEGGPRPAPVPAAYVGLARKGQNRDATTLTTCLVHGAGGYEVEIERAPGATRAQAAAADAAVTDLLAAFAAAVGKTPPLTDDEDDVDSTSSASWSEDEDDDKPTPTPDPPRPTPTPEPSAPSPEVAAAPDALPGYAPDISTFTSSDDDDDDEPTGFLPTSPVLMVRGRRLTRDTTDGAGMTTTQEAFGAELSYTRPLALEWEDFGYEYAATIGYDDLSSVTYDVRAGAGMRFAGSLALLAGFGLDAWTGEVALPVAPYLYLGARLPLGPVALRAEYLPRTGGDDERRLQASYTRFRDAKRKLAFEGAATFVGDATTLTLGLGIGL